MLPEPVDTPSRGIIKMFSIYFCHNFFNYYIFYRVNEINDTLYYACISFTSPKSIIMEKMERILNS